MDLEVMNRDPSARVISDVKVHPGYALLDLRTLPVLPRGITIVSTDEISVTLF